MRNSLLRKTMAICLLSSTMPSVTALTTTLKSAQAVGLLPRQNAICGGLPDLKQCGGNFDPSFCCQAGAICISFNNDQNVLCCPAGNNCRTVMPISCSVNLFNATLFPNNPLHGSKPVKDLAKCGEKCCPPGFTCKDGLCLADDTSTTGAAAPASLSSAPGTRPTPTPTSVGSGPANTNPVDLDASVICNQFPVGAVLVGFFPGLIVGSLLTIAFILCCGRRNKQGKHNDSDSTLGPVAAKISDPIYHDNGANRTDFLRRKSRKSPKTPSTLGSRSSVSSPPISRVRSLFSRTPTMTSKRWDRDSQRQDMPATPPNQIKREPSMESITIWSPPDPRMEDRQTTYEDVMKAAGADPKERYPPPFLGSPGMVDPRKRGVDDPTRLR